MKKITQPKKLEDALSPKDSKIKLLNLVPPLASEAISPLSWRDPAGRVFRQGSRIFRTVTKAGVPHFEAAKTSKALARFIGQGNIVAAHPISQEDETTGLTRTLSALTDSPSPLILEHPKLFFPSFSYEWTSEMLWEAGHLTIDLALALEKERLGLKDASAHNILFDGVKPVFVDWLSFEKRSPNDLQWLPYAQFVRHFINPLLLNSALQVPLADILLKRRDGIDATEAYPYFSLAQKYFSPRILLNITLPRWLSRTANAANSNLYKDKKINPEKASFILHSVLESLRRSLERLAPSPSRRSTWSSYMDKGEFVYNKSELHAKENFVRQSLSLSSKAKVLDVGANTGHFSVLAAELGHQVVAIDFDEVSVGEIFRKAQSKNLDILPLVVDFARPTPAIGWRNQESASFLERARGQFDSVLMLAIIHHLVASERIPVEEIVQVAAELTTNDLVVEYINHEDRQFRSIARGRDYSFFTSQHFETVFQKKFNIVNKEIITPTRTLYRLNKK